MCKFILRTLITCHEIQSILFNYKIFDEVLKGL